MVKRFLAMAVLVAVGLAVIAVAATKQWIVTSNDPAEIDKNFASVIADIPALQAGRVYMNNSAQFKGVRLTQSFGDTADFVVAFNRSADGNFRWVTGDANQRTVKKVRADSIVFSHQVSVGDSGWYYWIATKKTQ